MDGEEPEFKTGLEVAEEEKAKDKKEIVHTEPTFERFKEKNELEYLVKNNPNAEEIIAQEEMWFKITWRDAKRLEIIKKKLLKPEDYQRIGNEDWIKKSGVRKIANATNTTTEIIKSWTEYHDWGDKEQMTMYKYRDKFGKEQERPVMSAPKGVEMREKLIVRAIRRGWFRNPITGSVEPIERDHQEAAGSCSNIELAQKKGQAYNAANVYQTAETRGTSRAILNLVGSGKVSSEEILYDEAKEKANA